MIDPLGLYIPRSAGSVSGSVSGLAMSPSISSLLVLLCSGTGSFANLIIAAEKLAQEHDSPKIDHYWADELKSLPEYIRKMVEKFPETFNESAKFRLLHKKDETRLWKRVESELSATKSLCDELSETFQHLAGQIQDADKDEGILVKELFDSFTDLAIVNDGLKDILRLVSLEMTLHDRLKICTVIVVKTLDDLERNSSDSLAGFR